MKPSVSIVRTGVANTASVVAAFERLGCRSTLIDEPRAVRDAERLVLPGVGSFEAAMARLADRELVEPLYERVTSGAPTLAVCLGLQLLGVASEESPGTEGIGVVDATATRFPATERVPHLGWNRVESAGDAGLREGDAYFAHAYRWERIPDGWEGSVTRYGEQTFVAAVRRGRVLACQFHPELSSAYGRALLADWLQVELEALPC